MLRPTSNLRSLNGTSLKGYVHVPYRVLVEKFGPPNCPGDDYKTDAEWVLADDEIVVTLYNYKDGKNYNGPGGRAVEDITCWHIGGKSQKAVEAVRIALPDAAVESLRF